MYRKKKVHLSDFVHVRVRESMEGDALLQLGKQAMRDHLPDRARRCFVEGLQAGSAGCAYYLASAHMWGGLMCEPSMHVAFELAWWGRSYPLNRGVIEAVRAVERGEPKQDNLYVSGTFPELEPDTEAPLCWVSTLENVILESTIDQLRCSAKQGSWEAVVCLYLNEKCTFDSHNCLTPLIMRELLTISAEQGHGLALYYLASMENDLCMMKHARAHGLLQAGARALEMQIDEAMQGAGADLVEVARDASLWVVCERAMQAFRPLLIGNRNRTIYWLGSMDGKCSDGSRFGSYERIHCCSWNAASAAARAVVVLRARKKTPFARLPRDLLLMFARQVQRSAQDPDIWIKSP